MSSLHVMHTTADGHQMMAPSDAFDIAQRVQKGDATLGWEGDPRMHVSYVPATQRWEVWRLGEDGRDRLVKTWHPSQWDQRVLRFLAEHDSRHVDVVARMDKENEKLEREREEKFTQAVAEAAEYARHASERLYLPGAEAPRPRVQGGK